jgi:hypothetical protein
VRVVDFRTCKSARFAIFQELKYFLENNNQWRIQSSYEYSEIKKKNPLNFLPFRIEMSVSVETN